MQAKELEANTKYYTRLLAFGTGKKPEEVREDIKRIKYFDAKEAIEYGLVDKVVEDSKLQAEKRVRLRFWSRSIVPQAPSFGRPFCVRYT